MEEQLSKGGPETSDSERATGQVFQNPDDRVEQDKKTAAVVTADAAVHTLLQLSISHRANHLG